MKERPTKFLSADDLTEYERENTNVRKGDVFVRVFGWLWWLPTDTVEDFSRPEHSYWAQKFLEEERDWVWCPMYEYIALYEAIMKDGR